ncbi:MAG: hypothetical protein GXY67_06970 [Clostridiales bacterium]|nr:hypothetical protein [Clostridiales bacterium]
MKKFLARFRAAMRQPKWRHGRLSALMFTGFLIVCVLVNIGIRSLEMEYGWRRDFSFNGYASTGEQTRAVVESITQPITLYLLYQGGNMDSYLLELLNRYGALSDLLTVTPTDIAKNPGILTRFQGSMETALQADTVVVNCEATGRYRVLGYNDFQTQGYNMETGQFEITGLAYEKKLTEALAYVTQETVPLVGILQGHGELTLQELASLTEFLYQNNYDSKAVSLATPNALEEVDLLLIASPQKDLGPEEIAQIDAFAKEGGSLFVIRDYTDPMTLPNYHALLKNYGVTPLAGVVIAGEEDDGSYYGERVYLLPYMEELDMTRPLLAADMDVLLLAGACAFENPGKGDGALWVDTVLKTGEHAYLRSPSEANTTIDRQPSDPTGVMSLALISRRMHSNGNISRMFAIGNSTVFTDEYIYQRTFNGQFIMQVMGELLPQKTVSLEIMASPAFHPGLRAGGQALGIGLLVGVPLLVLVAGVWVLLPRRNR